MGAFRAAVFFVLIGSAGQSGPDPGVLLKEADRLAWLRAWSAAEPHFLQAQKLFAARGNERDALYAEVSAFRGALPRMSVPAASARLADYLEHPIVQDDDRLRLRVLVIKGETDEDLDPTLAAESWRAAQTLAESLGDAAWANRARGELGLVAFLQGDVGGAVVGLGQAIKVAQSNGDVSSLVRWLTLFGHGYVQLGRAEEALAFYDRALAAASAVPEIQFPVMTHVGRSSALIRLGRLDEADAVLAQAGDVALRAKALGYQAQLLSQRGMIANQRGQPGEAVARFDEALALARAAGANRLIAEIALESARVGAAGAIGVVSGLSQLLGNAAFGIGDGNRTVVIAGSAADATAQASAQVMSRFLNRLPTITIREGHRVKVYITSDLDLPEWSPVSTAGLAQRR